MTKRLSWLIAAAAIGAFAWLLASLSAGPERPLTVVAVQGAAAATNYVSYAAFAASLPGQPMALLARDGDLLSIRIDLPGKAGAKAGSSLEMTMPYSAGDGTTLSVAAAGPRGILAGRPVFLDLGEPGGWDWLETAGDGDLAGLRFVAVKKDAGSARGALLRRLWRVNPRVGLDLENADRPADVLASFAPRWLTVSGGDAPLKGLAGASRIDGVEVLFVLGAQGNLGFLARMPGLRELFLQGWKPALSGPLPRLGRVFESLVVWEGDLADLSAVAPLDSLRRLHLIESKTLARLDGLERFKGLRTLSLIGCEKVVDLSPLGSLGRLRRLGLPPSVTQGQLEEIVARHADLRGLELVECAKLADLSPLAKLKKLRSLVLVKTPGSLSPLHGLRELRYVGLDKAAFEKRPGEVAALRSALPNCVVSPVEGLCLGSGWILALLPILAAGLVPRPRRERSNAVLGEGFLSRQAIPWSVFALALGALLGSAYRWKLGWPLVPGDLTPFALVALAIGTTEELMFRGFIQARLSGLGAAGAVLAASLCHTAYKVSFFLILSPQAHPDLRFLAIATVLGGSLTGALRQASSNILPCVALHGAFDVVVYGCMAAAPWWVWAGW